jgi:hypothetical protein
MGPAANRRCPGEPDRTVREVFAEEKSRLLVLPDNPAPLLEPVAASVGKIPYVRFDLNDYSVQYTYVRRVLTVLADPHEVRIVGGATVLACHPRSYDKGAQIEDPAHVQALADEKRAARQHRGNDRLARAVPAGQTLLGRATERGGNLGAITAGLLRLLERYDAAAVQAAILEALERDVPHPTPCASRWSASASSRVMPLPSPSSCPRMCETATHRCGLTRSKLTISSRTMRMTEPDTQRARAAALNLHGLLAHWNEAAAEAWLTPLLGWEEQERSRRGLERRARSAHIGRFKPLCDFDWSWPKRCDRAVIGALMTLEFLNDATNVVLVGPNGVGKSTIAQNIPSSGIPRAERMEPWPASPTRR